MPHNISLPKHIYVYVTGAPLGLEGRQRGIWFGMGSTPGRALECHILLENGAMISNLPLHFLYTVPECPEKPLEDVLAWDSFDYDMEAVEFKYLSGLTVQLLDIHHKRINLTGQYQFSIDWVRNGFSEYPEQHKIMHVVVCEDGSIRALPTDRLLWVDASFTVPADVPPILRQTEIWTVEP